MSAKNEIKSVSDMGVLILAAGMGKRMRSSLPKVLHDLAGKPLLFHVLNQVRSVCPRASVGLVVGHGREQVEAYVRSEPFFSELEITFIHQAEQKGTGHAARCALDSQWGVERLEKKQPILVLPGDLPLISESLVRAVGTPLEPNAVLRVLTCSLVDPTGYGRIVRSSDGISVQRIVEEKDASDEERRIAEVATSIYLFDSDFLSRSLQQLTPNNAQGEYYLTDLVAMASRGGFGVSALQWADVDLLRGVNDPWELAQARQIFNEKCIKKWAIQGVQFLDPRSVRIECLVTLGAEVTIDGGVVLQGTTQIGDRSTIGPHVVLKNVKILADVTIKAGTVAEDSAIHSFAQVGPNSHLRPGSEVGAHSKIGNFVELKKTKVGSSTSIAHLSYLGDAFVGDRVNIGCGFVTCNFDGRIIEGQRKHKTVIEDDVFLGSACQAVAPITIGKGAYIASGSTITQNVEPGSLAIARARQVNKPDYAKKLRD